MGVAQPQKRYTPQEYYALERDAAYKSDYYDGEIFAMSGGTGPHSRIIANIVGEIHYRLKGTPYAVYESSLRVLVRATGLRTYPDASVFCGEIDYDPEDPEKTTATNPTVLFEVLSPTTELYNRGAKADHYRRIESLKTHVLIAQASAHVEVYHRQSKATWMFSEEREITGKLVIPSIKVELALADIYAGVEFPPHVSLRDG
jgi:Uma2 family endonuclease